jgi:hypothetical protein
MSGFGMKRPPGLVFQSAYIVNDLRAAMKHWHETTGAGPFYFMENVTMGPDIFSYRGTPSTVNFGVALGNMGNIQLELIQAYDDLPSAYRDSYKRGEEGFHHFGIVAYDYEAAHAHYAARYAEAQSGVSNGMRFAYFDARGDSQCMLEIVDDVANIRDVVAGLKKATDGWDGRNPYRPLTDLVSSLT